MQRLRQGETVVIIATPGETLSDEATLLRRRLLSADEQESVTQFVDADRRHERVIARALVRLGLSSCFDVAPTDWKFSRDPHQRPFVAWPDKLPAFQFSLSHTRGLVALLVTTAAQGGVDVEQMERLTDLPLIAAEICATSELESLNTLNGEARTARFYEIWTLKEAYAKARGLGLTLPWKGVAFGIGAKINVRFGAAVDDDPSRWRFSLDRPTPVHMLASAVNGSDGREIEIRRVQVRATESKSWLEC